MRYERALSSHAHSEDQILLGLASGAERVLELGCHAGHFSQALVEQGAAVVGVDADRDAIDLARARGIDARLMDLEKPSAIMEAGREFDVVLMANVLEHLRAPEAVLRDAVSVLRPSGRILISVPNVAHFAIRRMLLRGRFDYAETGIMDRTHLRFFTRASLRQLLLDTGWEITAEYASPGLLPASVKGRAIRVIARWRPTLVAIHLIVEARRP
jgi:2-polyprenyl-3-methyl-5-hydroxy-6-metoxy-1,4-benzoquinol methylase